MLNKDKSNQNEKTRNRTRYLLKEKSMKNILKVRMLGGFTLEYKGKELVLDRNNVSKTTQLFQLLLLHTQDGGISKAALIDALYGRSDVENKNGSLNNTIFRLRKQLTAAGLPESSYININGGMCTWDPDIETSVDVCDFKQTIESARHEKSQKTKMEIYAKAWKLYTGEFLPDMMGEDWAAVENIACRDMYFDCVEELCHYLKTEEKFEELYRVAHSAAEIYPFYDWQIWEIDSLIGMSRYKDGLDVYKRTTKLMFEELGLSPSAGMLERFKLMGERTSQAAGAIEDIKYRLREKESIEGAYYCTYPSFVDVYHVFGRMMERTGMNELNFPQSSTELRTYEDKQQKPANEKRISFTEVSNREQILEQRGSIDTLAVYVRYRQNATWQGSVYHMKNNEREDFNSELDLLKIIENCQNSTKNVAESG